MKKSFKNIFLGLAGMALASCVGYYLYKKNYTLKQQREHQQKLQQLREILFTERSIQLNAINNKFNCAYSLFLGKSMNDFTVIDTDLQKQNDINKRLCRKDLSNSFFYECMDCSSTEKLSRSIGSQREDKNQYSHQICEDCFDPLAHKGHNYKLIKKKLNGSCDCGYSYLYNENSFCHKHKGFIDVQQNFIDYFPNDLKEQIIAFFRKIFFILIDGQSDLIFNLISTRDKNSVLNDENVFTQFNILLNVLLDKITQIMNMNNSFVYCFVQLFLSPLEQSTRINASAEELSFLNIKVFEQNESIIEYLFRFQAYMNEQNIETLKNILETLMAADKYLVQFFAKKFLKLIHFAVKQETININDNNKKVYSLSELYLPCRSAFEDQIFAHNIYIESEEVIIKLVTLYKSLITRLSMRSKQEILLSVTLSSYILDFFELPDTLENFVRYEELIVLFIEIQEILFQQAYLEKNTLENLSEKIIIMVGTAGIQVCFSDVFYTITKYSQKHLNQQKKEKILSILCQRYKQNVEQLYQEMQEYKTLHNEDRVYLGSSIIQLITTIVIISEGPDISQESIISVIKKHFQLYIQEDIDSFINKISYILSCHLMVHSYHLNGNLLNNFTQILQQNAENEPIVSGLWQFLISSEYCQYDAHMFAYQLITSVQPNSDNIVTALVNNFKIQYFTSEQHITSYVLKPLNIIKQLMFDQTIFINMNVKFQGILSKVTKETNSLKSIPVQKDNNNNKELHINKEVKLSQDINKSSISQEINVNSETNFNSNINNYKIIQANKDIMIYAAAQVINNLLKWQPSQSKNKSEFISFVMQTLKNRKLIEDALQFFKQSPKNGNINLSPISNIENTSFCLGRYLNNLQDSKLYIKDSPYYHFEYVKGLINKQFNYQRKMIIKCFCEPQVFLKLREIIQKSKLGIDFLFIIHFYFNLWEDIITLSKENPSVFTEEQLDKTKKLEQVLNSKESFNVFYPKLKAKFQLIKHQTQIQNGINQIYSFFKKQQYHHS